MNRFSSIDEIRNHYIIGDIRQNQCCLGCYFMIPRRDDHKECPTGCFHDGTNCLECKKHFHVAKKIKEPKAVPAKKINWFKRLSQYIYSN